MIRKSTIAVGIIYLLISILLFRVSLGLAGIYLLILINFIVINETEDEHLPGFISGLINFLTGLGIIIAGVYLILFAVVIFTGFGGRMISSYLLLKLTQYSAIIPSLLGFNALLFIVNIFFLFKMKKTK